MSSRSGMSRRKFLQTSVAGAASAAVAMQAQGGAADVKPRIVVARGGGAADSPDAALKRMKAALAKFGGFPELIKGKKVLIKTNATCGSWPDGNTSGQAMGALLKAVNEHKPTSVTVLGQEWGGWDVKRKDMPSLSDAIKEAGATIQHLPHYWVKTSKDAYKLIEPQPPLWKELMVAKDIFEPDTVLLNLARCKSHPHCVFTGTIKNIIGLTRCMYGFHMVDDTKWPASHGDPANSDGWPVFAKKLAYARKLAVGPKIALDILDANEPCFGWRGPGKERVHSFPAGAVIVGNDPLAIDVYGCGLLHKQEPKVYPEPLGDWTQGESDYIQFNRSKTNYLKVCAELGVGQADLSKVDVQEVTA